MFLESRTICSSSGFESRSCISKYFFKNAHDLPKEQPFLFIKKKNKPKICIKLNINNAIAYARQTVHYCYKFFKIKFLQS